MSRLKQQRLKLIIAGDFAVGKTSLVKRFMGQDFSPSYKATMGVECFTKSYRDEESNLIDLSIWDLSGQTLYRDVAISYAKESDLVILVFDVTRQETFNNIKGWHKTIYDVIAENSRKYSAPCMIIGNKIDLDDKRTVKLLEGVALAGSLKALYIETSAKTGKNVDKAFNSFILKYIRISKLLF